jgi:hypothetical protein
MEQTPLQCPECGEIVLAWRTDARTLVVPLHPDRISPFVDCGARALATPTSETSTLP